MEQSYLRFSLEESVWFKKGQEVAEFLSISLDPVVTVDEYEQYITIRGALQLSGEFLLAEGEESDTDTDSFDFVSHRFIQRVSTREDGISELSHRFPIDITIPKNRIHHLEDVYVTVESFDYDLSEDGRLLVTADISISGISEVPLDEPSLVEEENDEPLFEPFEVVARKEVYEEEQRNEQPEEGPVSVADDMLTEQNEEQEEAAADRKEKKHKKENVVPLNLAEQTAEKKEAVMPFMENEPVQAEEENKVVEENKVEEVAPQQEAKVSIGAIKENDEDIAEEVEDENEKTKVKSENALYLTKLFAKNQAEEFTKVKICIVQQGDSLDKIAERYDLTVQQLLRANQLESPEEIHEGQLLYIPALVGSRP
ncbi:stage VI sporulation protein D [Parageobacillus genomosp. 1]|uniref:Stage VI sporulation protein D n=1 Tax=Parageobacillus genomosp. 1 TaxID=1295642 RepID=A0ABC9VDF4_9BACL|nr:stage VI sporulation protein D [Parageobacillus genomosp. 1]EZP76351.1 stage VI sporulation protein D [Parageobacillus genomosp. 1]